MVKAWRVNTAALAIQNFSLERVFAVRKEKKICKLITFYPVNILSLVLPVAHVEGYNGDPDILRRLFVDV